MFQGACKSLPCCTFLAIPAQLPIPIFPSSKSIIIDWSGQHPSCGDLEGQERTPRSSDTSRNRRREKLFAPPLKLLLMDTSTFYI